MSAPIGVGLVGCGRIARMFHLPILRDLPSARLVAVAEQNAGARAAALELAPGTVGVADVEGLLAMPAVEAVVICLPTHLHAETAIASFEAGRHTYVEKPLALDGEEARRVHAAWAASGKTGAMGFNFRFHPLYRQVRQVLADQQLGEVVALRSVFSSAPREVPEWKRVRETGGGALLDLASHHVDLVRFLLGAEVQAVSASISSRHSVQDTAAVTLQLSTGAVAQLLATVSAAASDRIEVLGTSATLEADRMGRRRLTVVPASAAGGPAAAARALVSGVSATLDRLRPPPEPSFAAALTAFVDDARTGAATGATIEDGVRSLAVVEAAEESAATGALVSVAQSAGPTG
ncbi:Gfo/Idh/MocA family protein [Modestobacter sp. VKM Ac-2985]|uniref:Gfo/Idh/MocA family protein n=1 Tax=Modestobacter sp. VKM Ac-2985 TaxID=3004139 RepID=UPI0022AB8C80|nr:Gfo/Idh/MocA family oxidoreductase [Modestobacter sp. VKM Ac-2985]MCZ2837704.1 Gfo/Idh/MocA family oxidoreductase [Modestobacter sp. VKM Ac-2985]